MLLAIVFVVRCCATTQEPARGRLPQGARRRRRSRSRGGVVRRARGGAGGSDVDLTLHMSAAKNVLLNESDKEKLREVVKVHETQVKFGQYCDPAASGASVALRAECRAKCLAEIPGLANPIHQASQFVTGISHHYDFQEQAQLWDVVRSIASTKVHYLHLITEPMAAEPLAGLDRYKFGDAFPNLSPPSCGLEAHTEESWLRFQQAHRLRSKADLVKHILKKHDGEARLVGDDDGWIPFPVSDGGFHPGVKTSIRQAVFWHYQFATNPQVRFWLHQRSQEHWADEELSSSEIQWMMDRQNNENTLLRYQCSLDSASGGWRIRKGNYITLAEVF